MTPHIELQWRTPSYQPDVVAGALRRLYRETVGRDRALRARLRRRPAFDKPLKRWAGFGSTPIAHTGATSADNQNVTSGALTTTLADLLIVIVHDFGASAVGTVSDSKANSWNPRTSYQTTTRARCTIFWSKPTSVGTLHTFTYSGPASCFPSITVSAWSGSQTAPYNVENGGTTGAAATVATGSVTPGGGGALLITGLTVSTGTPASIDSGFTITDTQAAGGQEGGSHAYLIGSGAQNPTWTNGASTDMAAAIAVFLASGSLGNFFLVF